MSDKPAVEVHPAAELLELGSNTAESGIEDMDEM